MNTLEIVIGAVSLAASLVERGAQALAVARDLGEKRITPEQAAAALQRMQDEYLADMNAIDSILTSGRP